MGPPVRDMPYEHRVILWVAGRMDVLSAAGIVSRSNPDVAPSDPVLPPPAVAAFDQLHASGFRPPVADVRSAIAAMTGVRPDRVEADLVALVCLYGEIEEFGTDLGPGGGPTPPPN